MFAAFFDEWRVFVCNLRKKTSQKSLFIKYSSTKLKVKKRAFSVSTLSKDHTKSKRYGSRETLVKQNEAAAIKVFYKNFGAKQ